MALVTPLFNFPQGILSLDYYMGVSEAERVKPSKSHNPTKLIESVHHTLITEPNTAASKLLMCLLTLVHTTQLGVHQYILVIK